MTASNNDPELLLEIVEKNWTLRPGEELIIGSAVDADVHIARAPLRWLRIWYSGGWVGVAAAETRVELDQRLIEPLGDETRTLLHFTRADWQRVRIQCAGKTLLFRGRIPSASPPAPPPVPPPRPFSSTAGPTTPPAPRPPAPTVAPAAGTSTVQLTEHKSVIGRSGHGAELQIPGSDVAPRHASATWDGRHVVIRDLRGGTGTYVDGAAIAWATLAPGESFVIGHCTFQVINDGALEFAPLALPAALDVRELTITYRRRRRRKKGPVMTKMSFALADGGFLAILGPSGTGKSTLFNGMLGEAEIVGGSAFLDGDPISTGAGGSRLVSYVPQPNCSFPELTVRQILVYAARLRLPRASTTEVDAEVDRVVGQLHLGDVANERAKSISGGQSRRLNVAMELLSKPILLLLDEPTSGLDEGLDRQLMADLARLSATGCVVIVITHTTRHLDLCDAVLAIRKAPGSSGAAATGSSSRAYFGPVDQLLPSFGATSHADVMDALRDGKSATGNAGQASPSPAQSTGTTPAGLRKVRHVVPWWHACRIGVRREVRRMSVRLWMLALQIIGGPFLATITAGIANPRGLAGSAADANHDLATSLVIVCVFLSFLAMALSLTSIVTDRYVIIRERRWGVTAGTVIASRALSLLVPAGLQALIAAFVLLRIGGPPEAGLSGVPTLCGLTMVLTGLTVTSMCLGLLISAAVKNAKQAVEMMSVILAMMVILCGLVMPLGDAAGAKLVLAWLAYLSPTRWAVSGLASYVDLPNASGSASGGTSDAMWQHDLAHFVLPLVALAVISALALAAASYVLHVRTRRPQDG